MSEQGTVPSLAMKVAERGSVTFTLYEPRDIRGFDSDIARALNCSGSEFTKDLLHQFDELEDDHHYEVTRYVVHEAGEGPNGEEIPCMIRVTVAGA